MSCLQFDVLLPADVLAIMDANRNFYKVPCTLPPCLKKVKVPVETGDYYFNLL